MSGVSNCPNCGAIMLDNHCSYCGTVIYDFTSINDEHPTYIKLRSWGRTIQFKALLNSAVVTFKDNPCLYCDNEVYARTETGCVNLELDMLYDEDGVLFKIVDKEDTE